jgi:hypothetical protein
MLTPFLFMLLGFWVAALFSGWVHAAGWRVWLQTFTTEQGMVATRFYQRARGVPLCPDGYNYLKL